VPPQLLGTLAGQTASRFRSTAARAGVDVAWIDPGGRSLSCAARGHRDGIRLRRRAVAAEMLGL